MMQSTTTTPMGRLLSGFICCSSTVVGLWVVRGLVAVAQPARGKKRPRPEGGLLLRLQTWWRLMGEYGSLKKVYESHRRSGFFAYGAPCTAFEDLGAHPAYLELARLRRREGYRTGTSEVVFEADFPVLPTYLPIEQGAGACLALVGLCAADLWESRGGKPQRVTVRQSDAGLSTAGYMFFEVDAAPGYSGCKGFEGTIAQEGVVNPTRKAYRCGDGRFVFLHGGFPKLKQGILDFFDGCPATVEAIADKCLQHPDASELEASAQRAGLAVTMCRTPAEWRASDQGKAVLDLPAFNVTEVHPNNNNNNKVRVLKPGPRPLSDVIVVDFSHVIASPMVGRSLAEHGATVFKVVTSKRPRRKLFDEDTNSGKVPLQLDLDDPVDLDRLRDLLDVADVLIDGFTHGVLLKYLGGSDAALHQRWPHLIYLSVSCYGHVGPWRTSKGFQQNANFAAGVATVDDEALLCYQLTSQVDYTTGFLGTAAVLLALTKRQHYAATASKLVAFRLHVSLCQAAVWMAKFGASMPSRLDFYTRLTRLLFRVHPRLLNHGNLHYLPPAVSMSLTPPARSLGFHRWWSDDNLY